MVKKIKAESEYLLFIVKKYFDGQQFKDFLKELDLYSSGPKMINFIRFTETYENAPKEQKKELYSNFFKFLIDQIKYTTNRIVITSSIKVNSRSNIYSKKTLLDYLNKSMDELELNIVDSDRITKKFNKVFQHISLRSDDRINVIENIYSRKVKYEKPDKSKETRFEFVWNEIDTQCGEVRMHIISSNGNNLDGEISLKPATIFEHFKIKLRQEFLLSFVGYRNSDKVNFRVYKELTEYAEKKYVDLVAKHYDEITNFTAELMKESKLNIPLYMDRDLKINDRISRLFQRLLIEKDWDNFKKQHGGSGKIKKISLNDGEGARITVSTIKARSSGNGLPEFDLEKMDVYFDTKETVLLNKRLDSVTILWNSDIFGDLLVKYVAAPEYMITHFLYKNINKEVYLDVLPRIREFER